MEKQRQFLHQNWSFATAEHDLIHTPDQLKTLAFQKATVPGTNLGDLQDLNLVLANTDENYEASFSPYRFQDFIYKTSFQSNLAHPKVALCFDGLDTVCDIFLNGEKLAAVDNCFVGYRYDISEKLKPQNELCLIFRSPMIESKNRRLQYGRQFPTHLDLDYMFLRKPGYSFFWDWGPAIPVSGIYKAVYLEGVDSSEIKNYQIRYEIKGKYVHGRVTVETPPHSRGNFTLKIGQFQFHQPILGETTDISFQIDNASLWFPNGAGDPHLYDLSLELTEGNRLIDRREQKIGFRSIEILQDKRSDNLGNRFRFRVNGVDIFCRGYNWIPFDNDITVNKKQAYQTLVTQAQQSHVNMLRVWGGGFYEDDEFYRQCDQLGILVWQDGMFACALYPDDDPAFMASVALELEYNIKRLRNFTSLAIWCGENECHEAYYEWWHHRREEFPRFFGKHIYHELFPSLVKKLDPDRFYWFGSPYSEGENQPPNSLYWGDCHPWDLFKHSFDFTNYRLDKPSFVSETGIQAFPDLRTALSIGKEEDHYFQSLLFERRNHFESPAKNERLLKFIAALFRINDDFAKTVLLSELAQAEYLKYAVEHWRSYGADCGGVLIWQFNDCWPAISWSAVDYNHIPKALYYYMKRAFANEMVGFQQNFSNSFSPEEEQHGSMFVTSDQPQEGNGQLQWTLQKLCGTVIAQDEMSFCSQKGHTTCPGPFTIPEFQRYQQEGILKLHAIWQDGRVAENIYPLTRPKFMKLRKPEFSLSQQSDNSISISSDTFAKGVYLWHPELGVVFKDNFFDLLPNSPKVISANRPISKNDIKLISYHH